MLGLVTVGTTVFCRFRVAEPWGTIIGCLLAFFTGIYSIRTLVRLVGMQRITRCVEKFGLSSLLQKLGGPAARKAD